MSFIPIDWRGHRAALDCIFTRRPAATLWPVASERTHASQTRAIDANVTSARGIDLKIFALMTCPSIAVSTLLGQFYGIVENSDNLSKHSFATLLSDRGGMSAHRVDGSTWTIDDFLKHL